MGGEKMEINDAALKGRAAFCRRVFLPLPRGEGGIWPGGIWSGAAVAAAA